MNYIQESLQEHATPVDELKKDPANAREHSEKNLQAIEDSLDEFGQRQVIVARENGTVIAGNARLEVARDRLEWEKIACIFVDDDAAEAARFAIADNRTGELAEWDEDALGQTLEAISEETGDLDNLGFDDGELTDFLNNVGEDPLGQSDEKYVQKIDRPVYEPTGAEPDVEDLYDAQRTRQLVDEIQSADIPEDVAQFLQIAAWRHTSFQFGRIAEFYAHADEEVQNLMERSGLVVVDFERAVEEGFVKMTERLAELVGKEWDGGE